MKAVVRNDVPAVLASAELQIDHPMPNEVLIRTVASGLCHSDLHFIDSVDFAGFPIVFGHEAAGIVEAVGGDVSYVSPGDHVVTNLSAFCGECEFCLGGRPVLCANKPGPRTPEATPRLRFQEGGAVGQFANLGAFAEKMLVHEHAVVKIDPTYPFDRAAIVGCCVATGLGSVFNSASVRSGSSVAVIGCGGVGLSVIQGAAVAGARRIIAVDTKDEKFALAETLGATDWVNGTSGDAVGEVMELTGGGVDFSFDAVGGRITAGQSIKMLRPGGVATLIGAAIGQSIEFDLMPFLTGERKVQGAFMGSIRFRTDLPRYIELDQRGRINLRAMIDEHITLDQVNDGFDAMRSAAINGRKVIMFD